MPPNVCTVTGNILSTHATPLRNFELVFRLMAGSYDADNYFPAQSVTVFTDFEGAFTVDLWVNEEGGYPTGYQVDLPRERKAFSIPVGTEAATLTSLLLASEEVPTPGTPQYNLLLTFIQDNQGGTADTAAIVAALKLDTEFLAEVEGAQGPQGLPGVQGVPGETGSPGQDGAQGLQGETGPQGAPGQDGADGTPGAQGLQGETGPEGPQGLQGETGPEGPQGMPGQDGETGPPGPQGDAGQDGADGLQGVAGPPGQDGADGAPGLQGPEGPQGETGPQGDPTVPLATLIAPTVDFTADTGSHGTIYSVATSLSIALSSAGATPVGTQFIVLCVGASTVITITGPSSPAVSTIDVENATVGFVWDGTAWLVTGFVGAAA